MAVDIPRKSLLFGMLLLSDVLRFGLAMWRPSFWSQDCDLDKAGEKTRGFYDEPEVFHIYEENPRFLSAPEEFCRFGCLRYIYNIYDIFDVQSHSKTVSHINIITTLQKHHLAACAVRPCSSCKTSSSGNSSHYPKTSLLHADWFAPGCQPPWNPKKHMNWLGQWHWPGNMTSQHMLALVEAAVVAKCCKSGLTSRWS